MMAVCCAATEGRQRLVGLNIDFSDVVPWWSCVGHHRKVLRVPASFAQVYAIFSFQSAFPLEQGDGIRDTGCGMQDGMRGCNGRRARELTS